MSGESHEASLGVAGMPRGERPSMIVPIDTPCGVYKYGLEKSTNTWHPRVRRVDALLCDDGCTL